LLVGAALLSQQSLRISFDYNFKLWKYRELRKYALQAQLLTMFEHATVKAVPNERNVNINVLVALSYCK
jgi:hypothetical protein